MPFTIASIIVFDLRPPSEANSTQVTDKNTNNIKLAWCLTTEELQCKTNLVAD